MSAFLEVSGLTKVYRGGWGLHDVSLTLPRGVIAALGGPNGSGKSTLLRCLAGLARHTGRSTLEGEPLGDDPRTRRRVGFLPQTVTFPERATIGEILDLFARLRGADPASVPLPAGFVRPDDDVIGELSGGQRHRVALAVALLGSPRLLLLDEPIASLDEDGRAIFWEVLTTLRDRDSVTSIVSSPSPSELRGVADVGLFLDDGRLVREEDFAGQAATVVHPFAHEGAPERAEGAPEGAEVCS
jgi:ABC-type multidrug transport system ATPase subunit